MIEEIFVSCEEISLSIEDGKLKENSAGKDTGTGIRREKGGLLSFSYGPDRKRALKMKPLFFKKFIPWKKESLEEDYTSEEILELKPGDLAERLKEMKNEARGVKHVYIGAEIQNTELKIKGPDFTSSRKKTIISYGAYFTKKDGAGYSYDMSLKDDIDYNSLSQKTAELCRKSEGGKKIEKGVYNVLLKPECLSGPDGMDIFDVCLTSSLSGKNVLSGESILKPGFKLGDVKIEDAPDIGVSKRKFDAEGISTKKKVLADKEVKEFLNNLESAEKLNQSPGNSEGDYDSLPGVGPSLLCLSGKKGKDYDIEVNFLSGSHTTNPLTGSFTVEPKAAFFDGKPLKGNLISGNVFEILKNPRFYGEKKQKGDYFTKGIITPLHIS